jgi:penicillin-insensitive murein DD-endopeptidase
MFVTRRLATIIAAAAILALVSFADAEPRSQSVGRPSKGRLENGVSMPEVGEGFVSYSTLGYRLGRQYVHSDVRDTLVAAFAARAEAEPGRVFVLGETGWKEGGRFRPHKTHQNGLSVDIFMPVNDAKGGRQLLPTSVLNRFGYGLEFDREGRSGSLHIDFDALGALLIAMQEQGRSRGLQIEKVIIAPEYVPRLLSTRSGKTLGALAETLVRKPVWVRHDEHVHIDFRIVAPAR